ncbi:hypothetical protein CQS04_04405 [Chryseomicrobium excrementi]|uniref:YheE family protein n=1 Tax=Chryseomicrobium excrementi TaxID=2041346 RepID=A0A2M9F3T7_9BACL|nr:DUF5342 family protein [Chryseomicrobium excrementi]PJK18126.1 hypothetical protein CQS04_04405 [Chryseomicrobium excrementi]
MLQHFNYKSLYENKALPGWEVSFYYKHEKYRAVYEKDGTIQWLDGTPENEKQVKSFIHELMVFHVYD